VENLHSSSITQGYSGGKARQLRTSGFKIRSAFTYLDAVLNCSVKSCTTDNVSGLLSKLLRAHIISLWLLFVLILLCCYHVKLRGVCGRMFGKTVNWKHLVGSRFCLIYLLRLLFVVGTLTHTKAIRVTRVSADIRTELPEIRV